jgi:PhnB protein
MAIDIYINFNGNCREAVEFYAEVFGIEKQQIMTFGEAPQNPDFPLSEKDKNLVMHTFLNVKGSKVMFSDVPSGMPFTAGNNISLTVTSKNIDEIKAFFNKMKEGGSIDMDLQETFWSKCYGSVTDKFGIPWQFSHDGGEMKI